MAKVFGKLYPALSHILLPVPNSVNQHDFFFSYRPEHVKRSHTLRYVLKDLGTGKPLFVVLFTLYLKEDVDEEGNLKEGVEGGKPLSLMNEKEKEVHEAKVCTISWNRCPN